MLISEIYQSRQGEGSLTGTESVFVRTSGCNLRCDFCDTPFTSWSPEGQQMSVPQIVAQVLNEHSADHVVITGGEPMLPRDMPELCAALSQAGKHITIETAGTIFQELDCDLMSISPKLSNSTPPESRAGEWTRRHEATRFRPEIVRRLIDRHDYQLKFVIDQPADIDSIIDYLKHVQPIRSDRVMLMPQGIDLETLNEKAKWIDPILQGARFHLLPATPHRVVRKQTRNLKTHNRTTAKRQLQNDSSERPPHAWIWIFTVCTDDFLLLGDLRPGAAYRSGRNVRRAGEA